MVEPQCGEDGLLDRACAAPTVQNQKDHGTSLLHDYWLYMGCLGLVEASFKPDRKALKLTINRYPDVPEAVS